MRTVFYRFFICLLAAVLLCSQLTVDIFAAVPSDRASAGQSAAEELFELGLVKGTGKLPDGSPNFDLARTLTRGEAVVMLVLLLGAEEDALTGDYSHPFTDAGWADAYIGYAYANHLTNGVSDTEYNTQGETSLSQFLTLVLHALGYSDVDWRNPYPVADAVGLDYPMGEGFYRADLMVICLNALDCSLKDQDITLRTKLVNAGVIDAEPDSRPAEAFVPGPVAPLVTEISVSSQDDFIARLAVATLGHAEQIIIDVPNGQTTHYVQVLNSALYSLSNPFSEAKGYRFSKDDFSTILFYPMYSDAARVMAWLEGRADSLSEQDAELFNAAQKIHDALVTPSMSEYDQVKAFHDYIVNNTEYGDAGDRSHSAVGSLLDGLAVCEGYADALDLLCYLSGIECICVNGYGNGGRHGWNKVKIDGQWYNVDVTWDDPISTQPVLRYDYFLVSDGVLARDHDWIAYSFWPVASSDYVR